MNLFKTLKTKNKGIFMDNLSKEDFLKELSVNGKTYKYYSIKKASSIFGDVSKLPFSLKIIFENLIRNFDNITVTKNCIEQLVKWQENAKSDAEVQYMPARVLMQDFTGVPAIVDLAAMRDAAKQLGKDPKKINPLCPVDLVIDHSVMVDFFGDADSKQKNVELEYRRNKERYEFLSWGQKTFNNFKVVPPGTGICHQVNVEKFAKVVWDNEQTNVLYPDTCVGTDSHTTMVNALGVLGWGVGGIEAEASMLGQPISMIIPEVIGFELKGKLNKGITATDLVLTVTNMLRKKGVVGKFVEFYGDGLKYLSLADRSTISNMAPEYGATCGIFPIDNETIKYLELTGRDQQTIDNVKAYAKEQGLFADDNNDVKFTDTVSLDLATVIPSLAGPKRPQDLVPLKDIKDAYNKLIDDRDGNKKSASKVKDGDVVIAAITSCTNTSNPNVLVTAALIAKKAVELGINTKPWVKTSFAPGSQVVTDYLNQADLTKYLDAIRFNTVGYGCTTCIGNSGDLDKQIEKDIVENELVVNAVLSGNRNFEGRVNPYTKGNWLASPPFVVLYALAGNLDINLLTDPIATSSTGEDIFFDDLWPSTEEVSDIINKNINANMFKKSYENIFQGDEAWQNINSTDSETYSWDANSTYIKLPPYFQEEREGFEPIQNAKVLLSLGDSITTDHISPAGSFKLDTPAGKYLTEKSIMPADFNSYGSRRGNHEIMMRGTFANIRIKNELLNNVEGGFTLKDGKQTTVYDAAMEYKNENIDTVVIGGKEYGTGSSRDWAAKGTMLLGVKAVIVESFERIHRSNLIGMGVLPFVFKNGINRNDLNLDGNETISIEGINKKDIKTNFDAKLIVNYQNGDSKSFDIMSRIDTLNEIEYIKSGGILNYVFNNMMGK